ncbi:MAG: hypothetical protein O2931_03475 [Planctomycetota bacterium]|nr:hypothetical protein [Planctomycetota bacterium]
MRDREVREDRKNTSPSQPSRNSSVPRDMVGESPISPDPRRSPDPTGNPPTGILDPATDLTPSDGPDSALPMTPSPGPVEPTEAFPTTDSTEPPTEVDPFNGLGSLTLPLPEIDLLAGAADVSLRGESPLTLHPDHSQPELLAVKSPKTSAEESSVTRATPRRKEPTTLRANRSEAVQLASVSDPISQRHNPLRLRISRDREDVKEVVEDVSLRESEIIEPIVPTVVESQQGSAKSHRKSNPLRRS